MKKVAVILACLALAGCTKDVRIASGGDVPVGFTPMTGNIATKSEYKGEQNATYTGNGSTYEQFNAWAKYTDNAATNPQTGGTVFFDGVTCVHGGSETNDYWKTTPTYFWPKNGYLTFHAFSPADLSPYKNNNTQVTHDWSNGFTITNFQAGTRTDNYRNNMVDILYSDFVFKKQRSEYSPLSGVPYDEASEESGYNHKGVNLTFHHALAGVQFRFKTAANYKGGQVTYSFTTKRIELLNMNFKGEFHENRTAAVDNTFRDAPPGAITFNDDNSLSATPYWIPVETSSSDEFSSIIVSTATTDITNSVKSIGSMMLVMPQNLAHTGSGNHVKVKVTFDFSYQVSGESAQTYAGRTLEIDLAGLTGKMGSTDYTINQWLINHKYIYTIVFHLDPLIFDPNVETFVEVSDINVDLPFQN